jgi:hypothetical protein
MTANPSGSEYDPKVGLSDKIMLNQKASVRSDPIEVDRILVGAL